MRIPEWLASDVITLALVAFIVWVSRHYLAQLITNLVKSSFERDLEAVRSELRLRESDIDALRSGALSSAASLQASIAQRRIQAADDLWQSVNVWSEFTVQMTLMSALDFDELSESIAHDPSVQGMVDAFSNITPTDLALRVAPAMSARPYLSDLTWALYSAYTAIFGVTLLKINILKYRWRTKGGFSEPATRDLLIKAVPEEEARIRSQGDTCHPKIAEILKEKILVELRASIAGKHMDADNVARSSEIVRLASKVHAELEQATARATEDGAT